MTSFWSLEQTRFVERHQAQCDDSHVSIPQFLAPMQVGTIFTSEEAEAAAEAGAHFVMSPIFNKVGLPTVRRTEVLAVIRLRNLLPVISNPTFRFLTYLDEKSSRFYVLIKIEVFATTSAFVVECDDKWDAM
jgi:hypothetical protein